MCIRNLPKFLVSNLDRNFLSHKKTEVLRGKMTNVSQVLNMDLDINAATEQRPNHDGLLLNKSCQMQPKRTQCNLTQLKHSFGPS